MGSEHAEAMLPVELSRDGHPCLRIDAMWRPLGDWGWIPHFRRLGAFDAHGSDGLWILGEATRLVDHGTGARRVVQKNGASEFMVLAEAMEGMFARGSRPSVSLPGGDGVPSVDLGPFTFALPMAVEIRLGLPFVPLADMGAYMAAREARALSRESRLGAAPPPTRRM